MTFDCLGRRLRAPAILLAPVVVFLLLGSQVALAAPQELSVTLRKDTFDTPLYTLVSWTPDQGATAHEIQRAYIQYSSQERVWTTVQLEVSTGTDGRLTARDEYQIGAGGVCYRVRTTSPVASEFTAEVCSVIPPASGSPAPPNTGEETASRHEDRLSEIGGLLLAVSAVAALLHVASGGRSQS